jgi:hypothetical protein
MAVLPIKMKQKGQYFIYKQPILHCESLWHVPFHLCWGLYIPQLPEVFSITFPTLVAARLQGDHNVEATVAASSLATTLKSEEGPLGPLGPLGMGQWESRKLGRVPSWLFDTAIENHHVQLKINTAIDTAIDTCSSGYLIQLFDTCLIKINH